MSHPRTAIRNAILAKLIGFVDIKQRVFASRPNPIFLPELPAILLYFKDEENTVTVGNENFPKAYERALQIHTDILIEGFQDPDTELDRFAEQVENCFFDEPTFGGICYGCRLFNTVPINFTADGDRNIDCLRMTWHIKYESKAYLDRRLSEFLSFKADTTDPSGKFLIGSNTVVRTK